MLRSLQEIIETLPKAIDRDIRRLSAASSGTKRAGAALQESVRNSGNLAVRDEDLERFLQYEDVFATTIRILNSVTLLCNTKERARSLFSAGIFDPVNDILKCCSDNFYYLPTTQYFDVSLYIRVQMEALQAALSLAHNRDNLSRMFASGAQETLEEAADNLRKLAKDLVGHLNADDVEEIESKFIHDIDARITMILKQKSEITDCSIS